MSVLTDTLADIAAYDLSPQSRYRPPLTFRAYGSLAPEGAVPLCAMETLCVALGDLPDGNHPSVSPILAAVVRAINDTTQDDSLRTQMLWPLLPRLISTSRRTHAWERDLLTMIYDRSLSSMEVLALSELNHEQISYTTGDALLARKLTVKQLMDLLRFAIRTYWDSWPSRLPREDWTPEQYKRITEYAKDANAVAAEHAHTEVA